MADVFVGIEPHVALARRNRHRDDLVLEVAGPDGVRRALVRFQRSPVLQLATDAVFPGDVFRRHAHVDGVERVVQRAEHHVDHLGVAHARTPAGRGRQVRSAAHALGAAADGDVGIAQQNGLRGTHHGLQAGAAQAVDVERGRFGRHAAVQRGHARQVHVARLGVDDVAEHHVADLLAPDLGARQRLAHHQRAQLARRHVLQAAAERPDCGAHTADHHHFTCHCCLQSHGSSMATRISERPLENCRPSGRGASMDQTSPHRSWPSAPVIFTDTKSPVL